MVKNQITIFILDHACEALHCWPCWLNYLNGISRLLTVDFSSNQEKYWFVPQSNFSFSIVLNSIYFVFDQDQNNLSFTLHIFYFVTLFYQNAFLHQSSVCIQSAYLCQHTPQLAQLVSANIWPSSSLFSAPKQYLD